MVPPWTLRSCAISSSILCARKECRARRGAWALTWWGVSELWSQKGRHRWTFDKPSPRPSNLLSPQLWLCPQWHSHNTPQMIMKASFHQLTCLGGAADKSVCDRESPARLTHTRTMKCRGVTCQNLFYHFLNLKLPPDSACWHSDLGCWACYSRAALFVFCRDRCWTACPFGYLHYRTTQANLFHDAFHREATYSSSSFLLPAAVEIEPCHHRLYFRTLKPQIMLCHRWLQAKATCTYNFPDSA